MANFNQRRALGALLAATAVVVSPLSVATDASSTTVQPPSSSKDNLSTLLSKASKLSDDSQNLKKSSPPPTAITTPAEAARARALLDRYYAISAEAQAANKPTSTDTSVSSSPKSSRTPATDAFELIQHTDASTPLNKRYVICGGGTAAWSAIEAILKKDSNAAKDILLVTEEQHLPYNRTMLSKELWQQKAPSDVSRDSVEYAYQNVGDEKIPLLSAVRIVGLNVEDKLIELSNGTRVQYEKVLLATGGAPKPPAFVSSSLTAPEIKDHVTVFRSLSDFSRVREAATTDKGVVVIGGGFLGTELAIALAGATSNVSLVIAEAGVLFRVLPRYLCEFLARRIGDLGVNVIRSAIVTDSKLDEDDNEKVSISLLSPEADKVSGKLIVVATGIDPEVDVAKTAGLEIDAVRGGVVVNDFMMAEPDVFVAGDMASFFDRTLGRRRVEHWDHAVVTGRIAGANMCGARERYGLQSMFWSDLSNIDVHITAVGLVDSKLETVAVWNTAMPSVPDAPAANDLLSGVVYYLTPEGEIVGVVLWNPTTGSGALRRARALVDARSSILGLTEQMLGDLVKLPDGSFRMTVRGKAS